MKRKLLITTQDLNMGGVETSLVSLLNHIDYDKWEVDLVALNDGILVHELNKNVNFINIKENTSGLLHRVLKSFLVSSLVRKYKNDKEYDVAIAYYGLNNYSDMYAAASCAKKKYIWVHNDFKASLDSSRYPFLIKIRNMFMKKKFNYFDKIVSVSNNCKKHFEQVFTGFEEKNIAIYNLLDGDSILQKAEEKSKISMNGEFNICTMARLVSSKQIDKLLVIVKNLKEKGYKLKTYIVGDGPERENLETYVKENHLTKEVVFTGVQKNPFNILKQADLFVSLSKYESLGLVLLEALVLDVPFVSLNNAGAIDIYENIAPENKGLLIDTEDNIETFERILNKEVKFTKKKFSYKKYNDEIKKEFNTKLGIDLK